MKDAKFTFYPAVREGYRPDSPFEKSKTSLTDAGSAQVDLDLTASGPEGQTVEHPGIELNIYGPGEVTNVDTDQIVRMEPEPDTMEFPPNYFPLVEFDDPELPWMFSPQRADDAGRNRPWLCLVVVPRQAISYKPAGTGPLPVLETPTDELPDPSETWAWAHAQVVGDHDPETELARRSTKTVSRLLCPRNLSPKTKYRACVVPTFEPGRRAGLGLEPYPDGRSAIDMAWGDEDAVRLPVYHSWEFTSAQRGDFESLARELDPVQFGPNIGFRTVDASNPGPEKLKLPADAATDRGTVGLGGALRSVGAEPDTYHEDMQAKLRDVLNTPSEVVSETDYGAVGPPLYGQWHAGVPSLEGPEWDDEDYYYPHWFNTLNADPRNRIAAGYGTQVIRDEQERLMANAWEQFGDLEEANKFLRRVRLAEAVLSKRHQQLESYSTGSLLGMSSPLHGTMLADETDSATVHAASTGSDLPTPLTSTTFRRLTRDTGPLARRTGVSLDTSRFVTQVETGRVPRMTDGLSFTTETAVGTSGQGDGTTGQPTDGQSGGPGEAPMQPMSGEVPMDVVERGPSSQEAGGGSAGGPSSGTGSGPSRRPGGRQPDRPGGQGSGPPGQGSGPPAGGPGGTAEGAPEPGPDVQRALTALDSLDTHVETARRAVRRLSTAVSRNDTATIREYVESRPTVLDHSRSIRRNTFDSLSRAIGKVLAQPRSETLSDDFDRSAANGHLQSLHAAQQRLEDAAASATRGLGGNETPRTVESRLDRATDALEQIAQVSAALRRALLAGPTIEVETLSMTSTGPLELDSISVEETPSLGAASPPEIQIPSKESLRTSVMTELDPTTALPDLAVDVTGITGLLERDDPVEDVLAAPSFSEPTYKLLAELNQEYFLPGIGDIPNDSIGALQTNPEFIEAFMTGLNHEFARELQWRNFPTDRRGTYFRRFWERKGNPNTGNNPEELADIEPIHTWDENDLGENSPHDNHAKVVLLIRGELLRRYPNTDIFAAKAVSDEGGPDVELTEGADGDRVPALPDTHVTRDTAGEDVKFPVFRGKLDPNVTFFGFDLSPDEALYDPYHEDGPADNEPDDWPNEGWFFVLQEPPAETRFGMDVGDESDIGEVPHGIDTDAATTPRQVGQEKATEVERGWSGLAWAHLVEEGDSPRDVKYVDVDGSRPGTENWAVKKNQSHVRNPDSDQTYDEFDAAEWGYNSAHMARATWQLPVRISIHADDMMPEEPPNDTDWGNVQLETLRPGVSR